MESNVLTVVFLPMALAVIMLGLGLSLSFAHFKQVFAKPKAVMVGLALQVIALPALAWVVAATLGLRPELAVGLVLIATCPGGPASNLIANLAHGDSALSITLTAISSAIMIFTLPFVINAASMHFMGEGQYVSLPILQTIFQVFLVTIIPVGVGMLTKAKFPALAHRFQRPVKVLSASFLALVILGAILRERDQILSFVAQVGFATIWLNFGSMLLGFFVAKGFGLVDNQCRTITIEVGIQNGTLGIAIATAPSLLNNSTMAIPAAIYSLLMFLSGAAVVFWGMKSRGLSKGRAQQDKTCTSCTSLVRDRG